MSFAAGITHGECETGVCPCKFVSTSKTVWTAAEHGDIDIIMSKHSKSPKSINKMDNYGYTPLHYAAQQNHQQIVQFLLTHGAQPDLQCCGATPLHRAAYAGRLESCELLLAAGADVNAQDYSFGDLNTPIQKAILQRHKLVIDLLLRHKDIDLTLENSSGLSAAGMLKNFSGELLNEISVSVIKNVIEIEESNSSDPNASVEEDNPTSVALLSIANVESPKTNAESTIFNDICCSICCQSALSYSRTKYNSLICLSCKYQSVGVKGAESVVRKANEDMWCGE